MTKSQTPIINHFKKSDPVLHNVLVRFKSLEFLVQHKSDDYFLSLCREIIGQQLSGKVAEKIYDRFLDLFPNKKPTAERLLKIPDEKIRKVGTSWAKVRFLKDLAKKVAENEVDLKRIDKLENELVVKELRKIKGVGPWTTEMFMMFALGREDLFSHGDYGLKKAMMRIYGFKKEPTKKQVEKGGKYGPYRQSERLDIYKKYADQLIKQGNAYYCFCTKERLDEMRKIQAEKKQNPKYDRFCLKLNKEEVEKKLKANTPHVIRMKIPDNKKITFKDLIMGELSFDSNILDDQVIIKSDGFPTYHLAVVVDDHLMEITHVIRGREWVSSTPKHILLYEFFGWKIPVHVHLPLILNTDGKGKLSKRHGHASVEYYKKMGYLPEAVLNYLSNLVWFHPDKKEIYTLEEFIKTFDLSQINSQGARFNLDKLDWINGEYIRKSHNSKLKSQIYEFYEKKLPENIIEKTIPLIKERIKKLSDYLPLCEFIFKTPEKYEVDLSSKKDLFKNIDKVLSEVKDWKAQEIGEKMVETAKKLGVKNSEYFMLLRVAITGKKISPPLNESMELLGKDECVNRIKKLWNS